MAYYEKIVATVVAVAKRTGECSADFWDFYDAIFEDVLEGVLSGTPEEAKSRLEGDPDFIREYKNLCISSGDWLRIEGDLVSQIELNAYNDAREVLGLE